MFTDESIFESFPGQGPPGTGKTTTCVAAVKVALSTAMSPPCPARRRRILLAAPSNAAANNLTRKLIEAGITDVLRFTSFGDEDGQVPDDLHGYTIRGKVEQRSDLM